MTWLSEIEESIERLRRSGYVNDISGELPYERMARVIRELANRIKEARAVCDDTPEEFADPQALNDAITNILDILGNLSDDAKELLEEEQSQ